MPGKLYPEGLAKMIRGGDERHYRPSNGSEGAMFEERWCELCARDAAFRQGTGPSCPIVAGALAYEVGDPKYPPEWTYDESGQPCCTAYEPQEQESEG